MNALLTSVWAGCLLGITSIAFAQEHANEAGELITSPQLQAKVNTLLEESIAKNWTFVPRVNGVSDRTIESLTGELPPKASQLANAGAIDAQAQTIVDMYRDALQRAGAVEAAPPPCDAKASTWDWRTTNKVTQPKLQQCGDCWAFASAAQIESAFLFAGWSEADIAEQHILDCSNAGDCGGGRRWDSLPWAATVGLAEEGRYPSYVPGYKGVKQQCDISVIGSKKLLAAGWIDSSDQVPAPEILKSALCTYGPISVSIYATPALQNYGGSSTEVFNENNNSHGTNHAILLIGWDDAKQAWLMKNSWGSRWGFGGGFGWVQYGSNNIGKWPIWAKAPEKAFAIPKLVQKEIGKLVRIASGH